MLVQLLIKDLHDLRVLCHTLWAGNHRRLSGTLISEALAAFLIWMLYMLAKKGDHPYYAGLLTGLPLLMGYVVAKEFVQSIVSAIRMVAHKSPTAEDGDGAAIWSPPR